jgi:hypothetical protein
MTISDNLSCGVTFDCHSNDSRVCITDRNIFIIQAPAICQLAYPSLKYIFLIVFYLLFPRFMAVTTFSMPSLVVPRVRIIMLVSLC